MTPSNSIIIGMKAIIHKYIVENGSHPDWEQFKDFHAKYRAEMLIQNVHPIHQKNRIKFYENNESVLKEEFDKAKKRYESL